MLQIDPTQVSTAELHGYLLGAVAPRPIAFASTIDKEGQVNLSPFSFFNVFGSNPPILVFSPARRVRDNTTKHSLDNVQEVPEVTINIVNFATVEQMSLASTEYAKGVNEFVKAGLTPAPSLKVKPPRVQEAPASFECKVIDILPYGDQGGSGTLVVCQVVMAHIDEAILGDDGQIDPFKLDAVSRMGGNWYCRANGAALFEIPKPLRNKGVGVDALPETIRRSHVLSGNNLARLGNVEALPTREALETFRSAAFFQKFMEQAQHLDADALVAYRHTCAKERLEANAPVEEAFALLNLALDPKTVD
ncbi:MAG: flavin reductase family protein [Nitritalea sp.]